MLKFIKERLHEYDTNYFINEFFLASKNFGILESKITNYKFSEILIPLLHKQEAQSSMYIEGTQTTISDIIESELSPKSNNKPLIEAKNYTNALIYGIDYLRYNDFSHTLIQKLHEIMLKDIIPPKKESTLGKYKEKNNFIVNSSKKVIFNPPDYTETKKYMDELIDFINKKDEIPSLIKSALLHSQFESIHPFEDGNGRVGRILIGLYLFKSKVLNYPFFYISEAISQDKLVYYNKLTSSRTGDFNEWIKFFLNKCIVQTQKHIKYIDSINNLYLKTEKTLQDLVITTKYNKILDVLFSQPILNSKYLTEKLDISKWQAKKYLDKLEEAGILFGTDKKRNKFYFFIELLEILRG